MTDAQTHRGTITNHLNTTTEGGRHSTVVAFSLRTQPSGVRIWLLEKSNQEGKKCFFREPAVLKLFGVSALKRSKKNTTTELFCMYMWGGRREKLRTVQNFYHFNSWIWGRRVLRQSETKKGFRWCQIIWKIMARLFILRKRFFIWFVSTGKLVFGFNLNSVDFVGRVAKQRNRFCCSAFFRFWQNRKPCQCFAAPRLSDFDRIAKQRNHLLLKAWLQLD